MIGSVDSSVLVAATRDDRPFHRECAALLRNETLHARSHVLTETFSTLTGGRLGFRLPPREAAAVFRQVILPRVVLISLSPQDHLDAIDEAESRGIRGGAIHDYLHLVAARKTGAARLYTLNVSDFRSFQRPGDPEIVHP